MAQYLQTLSRHQLKLEPDAQERFFATGSVIFRFGFSEQAEIKFPPQSIFAVDTISEDHFACCQKRQQRF